VPSLAEPAGSGVTDYPHALSPVEVGGVTIRNRVFVSAHGTNYPRDGAPSQQYIDYFTERAKGGVGLLVTEGTHVAPTSGGPYMIDMWRPSARAGLQALTDSVHAHGATIFCQIMHTGRQNEPVMTGRSGVGPSPLRDPVHSSPPHALTREEIGELVEAFAAAAQVAAETGFDGVEVHGAHGYLIEQFFSPFMNQRTDEYGGSHANRLRFGRDVMRAILDRVGDRIAVGARLTAFESIPGGLDRDESLQFTTELADEGLHFVSITAGQHSAPLLVVPPAGVPTLPFLDETVAVRKAVSCAVFASHRVRDLADVEKVVRDGQADMVNMARAHIADPELVNKARRGEGHLTRPCIGCVQGCRAQLVAGLPIGCLVNPRVGREGKHVLTIAERPRRIAVIGGGIAGMQFASTAAQRGHQVTLFEQTPSLGGTFARAAGLPERAELAGFTAVLARELEHFGVDVRLGQRATPADAAGFDDVVLAVGGRRDEVDTSDWPESTIPTVGVDEALRTEAPAGRRVVVVDRGDQHNIAILLARRFAEQGASGVDVLDPTGPVARRLDSLNRFYLTRNFSEENIRLACNVSDLHITGDTVTFLHDGWPQTLDDVGLLVVIETLRAADPTEWGSLERVIALGDGDAPGLAVEIVHEAYASALAV
jgi:2,4-dienoyl-CoA reductase-like NADH-dependent reductase (Old Yellow Enzyme family)